MGLDSKNFEVTINISVRRTEEIATGKAVSDSRTYTITDSYSEPELKVLISDLTPEANSTI